MDSSHVPPVTTCVQSQLQSLVSHEQHKTSYKDDRQQPSLLPLSSLLPPRHFWKKGAEVRGQGVPSRCIMAVEARRGRFQKKVTQPQDEVSNQHAGSVVLVAQAGTPLRS